MRSEIFVTVILCITALPLWVASSNPNLRESWHSPGLGIRHRCALTKAGWCGPYISQTAVPRKPAPKFSRRCQHNCNTVGSCDFRTGSCKCPAGWSGDDCRVPQKRPCTNRRGGLSALQPGLPSSHIAPDGRDFNWTVPGWTASRCAGICDEDTAHCYCDTNSTHGRMPAPPGSPPGTPPIKHGRSISEPCKPQTDASGNKVDWGGIPYEDLYGPDGWCNAAAGAKPKRMCGCSKDGWDGKNCEVPTEAFCPNQCTGHGECRLGYCKCNAGWFGLDCASRGDGNDEDGAIGE